MTHPPRGHALARGGGTCGGRKLNTAPDESGQKVFGMRLFHRFAGGEADVLELLKTHARLAVRASEKLQAFVSKVGSDDWAGAKSSYQELDRIESTADEVHKELVEKLSSGVFFSGLGADLMNLAEHIDGIADSAKDAARILIFRKITASDISPVLRGIQDYLVECAKAAEALRMAVESLRQDKEEMLKHMEETEAHEEAADEIKSQLVEEVYRLQLPVLSIIQLKDFIMMADNIGDHAEDAGDTLYVILAKGYS